MDGQVPSIQGLSHSSIHSAMAGVQPCRRRLYAAGREGLYVSKDVEVWISADGTHYTMVASGTLANSIDVITLDLDNIVAQRVKLVIISGYRSDYWELGAFIVNGVLSSAPTYYTLTVNNGSGDGSYEASETVIINADPAPTGMMFDSWVVYSDSPVITDVNAASTTLTMSECDAIIAAKRIAIKIFLHNFILISS
ncbi:MAG: InlB B-repeat-containing protein [bacterium]